VSVVVVVVELWWRLWLLLLGRAGVVIAEDASKCYAAQ
jgi:hypothetical protein